jgi:hypothetical protein
MSVQDVRTREGIIKTGSNESGSNEITEDQLINRICLCTCQKYLEGCESLFFSTINLWVGVGIVTTYTTSPVVLLLYRHEKLIWNVQQRHFADCLRTGNFQPLPTRKLPVPYYRSEGSAIACALYPHNPKLYSMKIYFIYIYMTFI